jgi:hypothetical protein
MKVRSLVNRRDFSVEPAGYFNVLRPSTRFIASHLQRRFPYLVRQSKGTDQDCGSNSETPDFLIKWPGTDARQLLRWVLIVLAAIGITFGWLYGSAWPWRHIVLWRW